MKALIQHNFTSGLGDCIVGIYEYLETAKKLKSFGYEVELFLNIKNNAYLYDENFFDLFNKEVFNLFSNVEIVSTTITQNTHHDLTKVYTLSNASSGLHWWDLFISDPNNFKYEWLSIYPCQDTNAPDGIKLFNNKIYEEYEKIKIDYGLTVPYKSIFFRTFDLSDEIQLFVKYEKLIIEIISSNEKIFVCSNSFKIKNKIKELDKNKIVIYEIPYENLFGNHFIWRKLNLSQYDLFEKTKYTIFDMLSLSDSIDISHITEFNRLSNFLMLSKINKKQIIPLYDY